MLVNVDVPASVGLASVETNVGSVRNSGLDFTVKWEDSFKDFRYGIRLTGTTIKNEVTNLGGKRITSGDIGSGKKCSYDRRRNANQVFLWLQDYWYFPK